MKLAATLLACLTAVTAQQVYIGYPPDQAKLTAGQQATVQIVLPNFLSSSEEVAVAIGIASCPNSPCLSPSDGGIGRRLYNGPYHPKREPSTPTMGVYQNFTLDLPSDLPKGKAQIDVAHFALIGASLIPWVQTLNTTVYIQ